MKFSTSKRMLTTLVAVAALILTGVSTVIVPQDMRLMQAGCACGRTVRWVEPAKSDHGTQYDLKVVSEGDPKHAHEYDTPQTIGLTRMSLWQLWKLKRTHEAIVPR